MSIVYSAEDPKLQREIAIKVLCPPTRLDSTVLARFEREARLLAGLNHPNIATIYSLEQHLERPFITMELVPGDTLATRLASGRLPLIEALKIGRQIAFALEAAHEVGVAHLDLKPANVRITPEGRVKLLDFGLARARLAPTPTVDLGEADSTLDMTIQGTPGYLSPEQLGGKLCDHRSDIWAFGCVMFELIAGSPAFPGRTAADRLVATLSRNPDWDELPAELPEHVRELIRECLEKDASDRPASMTAVRRLLEGEAVSERETTRIRSEDGGAMEGPTNLPLQLTSFIGRERAMDELARRLEQDRLVTVTGPGGCGKTRLSLEIARRLTPNFRHGVWLAELAPVAEPDGVQQAVANVFGVREDSRRSLEDVLRQHLKTRDLLLVVDNCEHLLEASARLVVALLQSCPSLRVLATSREKLGVAGESVFQLSPLATPELSTDPRVEELAEVESVRLFVERARAVDSGFTLTRGNAAALARICRRLDGIPLALELAAARIGALPPDEIERRLSDRFRLLRSGNRTALARHQTLQALVDWSFDHLSDKEQMLFRRLAVFAGGWPLEGAEEVCSGQGIERAEVLDLHSRLVEKSLVERESPGERVGGQVRYRTLETIREYAWLRLRLAGEEPEIRRRHQEWVLALATASSAHLVGPEQGEWSQRLEVEHDNIRAAVADALAGAQRDVGTALQICASLGRYWYGRGRWTEGRGLMKEILELPGAEARTASRAQALAWAGWIALWQGDLDEAWSMNEESLAIRRELGDSMGIAQSLNNLGAVAQERGEFEKSRAFHEESLAIRRTQGNLRYQAVSLHNLGELCFRMGDYEEARAFNEESLDLRRKVGDLMGIADSLNALGMVAERMGDLELARRRHEESLRNRESRQDPMGIAESLHYLAEIDAREGILDRALLSFTRSLEIRKDLSDRLSIAESLESIGLLKVDLGACRQATRLLASADALRAEMESPVPPARKSRVLAATARARQALGDPAFASEWKQGRRMNLDEAVALASVDAGPSADSSEAGS